MDALGKALDPLRLLVVGRYIDVAAGCLVIFDIFLTLDLEIKYIWKSRWNIVKVMYLINRYTTIVDIVLVCARSTITDVTHCPGLMKAEGVIYILGNYISEYMFAMRTYIIWEKKWIVWLPLCLYYIGTFIHAFYSYFLILNDAQYFPLPPFNGCIPQISAQAGSFSWKEIILIVVYDAAMIILIGFAAIANSWRRSGMAKSNLFRKLYGEGILFYIYLLVLSITALVTLKFFGSPVFIFMGRCVRSILASRVILHIREMGDRQKDSYPVLLGKALPS